ncbi:MAG: hypothetical protein ACRDA8_14170, partial [Shewanella sp.]
YQSAERPLADAAKGFGLGETEVALSANIDDNFYGKLTGVLELHDGETELSLEEAFVQTLALPAGFGLRAGRFLSEIGYLNNQHLHTDSFSGRPIVYRAFFGGHYFDDGLRLNWVAPTDLYWTLGLEAFKGERLRAEAEEGEGDFATVGVYTFYTKIGADVGDNGSWQAGLSYLRNANGELKPHEDANAPIAVAEDGHSSHSDSHSAAYTGKHTYGADVVYKWAPQGNYKYQHLTLSAEYWRVSDFAASSLVEAPSKDYHQGWYMGGVYQLSPTWSVGGRYGKLAAQEAHGEHFHGQTLTETELMLAWHPSHFSTVRLQYTQQQGVNFEGVEDDNLFTLQYIMSLGAHGAHQF